MPKKGIFWPFGQILKPGSATCEPRSRPPLLSFLVKLCVIVLHTHRYHPSKFQPNSKHQDKILIFPHFARVVVACCCLLPIFKAFRELGRVKTGHHGLKTG